MVIAFDLDDTLFPEIEFVRSAYREIARKYGWGLLDAMVCAPTPSEGFGSTGLAPEVFLPIYRGHHPDISLPMASLYSLTLLKNAGHTLALVTDGRTVTQTNKIKALGLQRFINDEDIFISESLGHEKTDGEAFKRLMERHPGERYFYVGDNPEKDFQMPRILGWHTVCLLDSGQNIHQQRLEMTDEGSCPEWTIRSLYELPDLVNQLNTL